MSSPHEEHREAATHRLMELLLLCGTAQERSAILLDNLLSGGLCESAALWRQVGTGVEKAWHPILSRGSAALLPTLAQLRAVACGELDAELGGGRQVLLPIGRHNFALTLGTALPEDELSEERCDSADALFHVWLAVEVAESLDQGQDLLDALPSLSLMAGEHDSGAPDLVNQIAQEASWVLDSEVQLEIGIDPECDFDPGSSAFTGLLGDLFSHAAAGYSAQPSELKVSVVAKAGGTQICFEGDGGWPPSLEGQPCGRFSSGLFDATRRVQRAGGDLRIEQAEEGSSRVTAWLPGPNCA